MALALALALALSVPALLTSLMFMHNSKIRYGTVSHELAQLKRGQDTQPCIVLTQAARQFCAHFKFSNC